MTKLALLLPIIDKLDDKIPDLTDNARHTQHESLFTDKTQRQREIEQDSIRDGRGTALLSVGPEQVALITIGTL